MIACFRTVGKRRRQIGHVFVSANVAMMCPEIVAQWRQTRIVILFPYEK